MNKKLVVFAALLIFSTAALHAQWTTSGTNIYNSNTGNVGIGTTPLSLFKLDVNGSTRVMTMGDALASGNGFGVFRLGGDTNEYLYIWRSLSPAAAQFQAGNNSGFVNIALNPSGGAVGIGTATPTTLLNLVSANATLRFGAAGASDSSAFAIDVAASGMNTNAGDGRNLSLIAGASNNDATDRGGNLILKPGPPTAPSVQYGDVQIAPDGGNVGIGLATPGIKLAIKNDSSSTAFGTDANGIVRLVNSNSTANNFAGMVFNDGTTNSAGVLASFTRVGNGGHLDFWTRNNSGTAAQRMRVTKDGYVGIGTTAPSTTLHVTGSTVLNGSLGAIYTTGLVTGYTTTGVFLEAKTTKPFVVAKTGTNTSASAFGVFNSSDVAVLYARGDGLIGIGTTTPTVQLDVVGNANFTGTVTGGNIQAKYQDLAEWVPSSQEITAGTVVVLDTEKSNWVLPSMTAYDTRVAGVVSAQPGILLGEEGAGKVKVATTGRVKVRVDASSGPIRVGDLLVTSSTPGVAMASVPLDLGGVPIHRPGTIIGKALEPLSEGVAEILVLLSLQ